MYVESITSGLNYGVQKCLELHVITLWWIIYTFISHDNNIDGYIGDNLPVSVVAVEVSDLGTIQKTI